MGNVLTPQFRVSYPNVFRATKNNLSGKDEYSLTALFPKGADLSQLKKAAQSAIEDKWGPDKKKWPKNLRSPFRDQKERGKEDDNGEMIMPMGYEEGAIFLTLKSQQRPGLVNESVQAIIDETEFYAGCWARATVRAYAYENKGNAGVAFGLQNVQKCKDGDPLSGRTKAEDDFAPIATAEEKESGADATSLFG